MSPAAVKTFSFYRETIPEPIPFVLNGRDFRIQPVISGMQLLQFVAATTQGGAESAVAVLDFLKAVVLPEDWDAFIEVTSDPRSGLGPEELGELAGWMSEQYTERPTEQSPMSLGGSQPSGPGLTVVAPSPGSTSGAYPLPGL